MKYIHLILHNETKFSTNLLKNMSAKKNGFKTEEHIFVTPHEQVCNALKGYEIILDQKKGYQLINKYAPVCDWLFVHCMCSPLEVLLIKKRNLKKIVWRTWGSDAGYHMQNEKGIRLVIKQGITMFARKRYTMFKAIGIGNLVDAIDIKEKYGMTNTFVLSYSNENSYGDLTRIADQNKRCSNGDINVIIEHSGFDLNHREILQMLCKFKEEPRLKIYIVLSYGNTKYIEELKKYIESEWGDKVTIITEFMRYGEYAEFLNRMDIAILDLKKSYALGNIAILLYFNKKIFLNKEGVIRKGFLMDNIPHCVTEELDTMTFEEFARPLSFSEMKESSIVAQDYSYKIKKWHECLNYLESELKTKDGRKCQIERKV